MRGHVKVQNYLSTSSTGKSSHERDKVTKHANSNNWSIYGSKMHEFEK